MATQLQVNDQLANDIRGIRAALGEAEEAPIATFVVDTALVDGFRTETKVRQFTATVDEPPNLGGSDQGPTPVELVLSALGTCQEIVYATYARVLGIPVESVSVHVEGLLDPRGFFGVTDTPAGFQEISFTVEVKSPASPEEIGRLAATVNAHCPVLDILRQPVPVAGTYVHNGKPVTVAEEPEPVFHL